MVFKMVNSIVDFRWEGRESLPLKNPITDKFHSKQNHTPETRIHTIRLSFSTWSAQFIPYNQHRNVSLNPDPIPKNSFPVPVYPHPHPFSGGNPHRIRPLPAARMAITVAKYCYSDLNSIASVEPLRGLHNYEAFSAPTASGSLDPMEFGITTAIDEVSSNCYNLHIYNIIPTITILQR